MQPAYRTQSTVSENGTVQLRDLPFRPGEALEVILIPRARQAPGNVNEALRGTVLRYDHPTAPVADEDWDLSG